MRPNLSHSSGTLQKLHDRIGGCGLSSLRGPSKGVDHATFNRGQLGRRLVEGIATAVEKPLPADPKLTSELNGALVAEFGVF